VRLHGPGTVSRGGRGWAVGGNQCHTSIIV
jgi:hypothetical protein